MSRARPRPAATWRRAAPVVRVRLRLRLRVRARVRVRLRLRASAVLRVGFGARA